MGPLLLASPVVQLIRDPVKRVISHFYFGRGLQYSRCMLRHKSVSTYLRDERCVQKTRTVTGDGQGGVWWYGGASGRDPPWCFCLCGCAASVLTAAPMMSAVHPENNWVDCRFADGVTAARSALAYPKTLAAEIAVLRRAAVNTHRCDSVCRGTTEPRGRAPAAIVTSHSAPALALQISVGLPSGAACRGQQNVRVPDGGRPGVDAHPQKVRPGIDKATLLWRGPCPFIFLFCIYFRNAKKYPAPTPEDLETVRQAVPLDIAFYDYVVKVRVPDACQAQRQPILLPLSFLLPVDTR